MSNTVTSIEAEVSGEASAQADFLQFLRDVVILLGGRVDIADMLEHPAAITAADVDALRQYGIVLSEDLKTRMASQSTMEIRV